MNRWFLVMALLTVSSHAAVYKCTDGSGKVNFTDKPCNGGEEQSELEQSSYISNKNTVGSSTQSEQRSAESIRKVLDEHKGKIYSIYNTHLRSDPTLEGKAVFEITISASGSVSRCEILENSTLKGAHLMGELSNEIRNINFGPWGVAEDTSIVYSFTFLPY